MKKIKYILLTLAIGLSATACYDDDAITPVLPQGLTDITLSVTAARNVTGGGFNVPFTATIPNSFSSDVDVEASLTFDGGVVSNSVTIPAGSTSASGLVDMQGTGGLVGSFEGKPVTLSLTGLLVTDPAPGEPSVFNVTSNEVALTSYDLVVTDAYGESTINGRMTHLFQFDDCANNDLDMLVFGADFSGPYETSAGSTCYERDIFDDTHPDGDYFIAIDFWFADGEDIAWHLFFVDPDRTTLTFFEGVFTNVTPGGGDFIYPLVWFTKTTTVDEDGEDVVSYTYSQPE